jgi:hypothetical protein
MSPSVKDVYSMYRNTPCIMPLPPKSTPLVRPDFSDAQISKILLYFSPQDRPSILPYKSRLHVLELLLECKIVILI